MKTILRTIPFFLVLMILTYFIPQIISDSPSEIVTQKKNTSELKKENKINQTPTLKQETFPLTGMGQYMGEPIETLKKSFGDPERIESTVFGYDRWIYGDNKQDYFQVGVSKENRIVTIFILGSKLDSSPFKIGTDITEVYQLATLYPTFSFDYENTNYTIELSENDLNYHPLVVFEKQFFAILMVDRKTNKINAIRYLDEQTLLQSDIYEINPKIVKNTSEKETNQNGKELETILNALRNRYSLSNLVYSEELSLMAKDIFTNQDKQAAEQASQIESESQKINETSASVADSSKEKEFLQNDSVVNEHMPLTSEQIQGYLKAKNLTSTDIHVVYSNQFTDSMWLITYWFSLENQRKILTNPEMQRFGFSFRDDEIMLILDKEVENKEKNN